ncbi:MAG: acetylglutamate kinase [Labilithrix sp.]|nr:acetylglutamate kinase [Labilithrix sp.]MCW5831924.1 acetylglutamate kinase [Labilithrix sp.]
MTNKEKETQDVIVRLLTNIGSRKEVEQYLKHYASVDAPKFAVVKVSGAIIDRSLDALASSMSFLQRVGLVPIVVHGGNVQLDRALAQAGVDAPVVKGLRKMTPAALEIARRVLHDTNLRLVEALEGLETRARPFTSGVVEAKKSESPDLGLIGAITAVREAAIAQTARGGVLPIVAPLGETPKGQILVVHADAVARAIALALKPHKVVFLNEVGGLVDGTGAVRSAVNLAEDYAELSQDTALDPESQRKLIEINALLSELPPTSSVSITSPEHLAKELFTHGGHGTLVRRGEKVVRHDDWSTLDRDRLRALLEECFARRLDERYFDEKAPHRVFLAESYRATAILTTEHGVPYLDKFAVTNEAQGEGIGGSLWQRMRRDTPKLFWRSRANNPVNAWYAQKADGLYKTQKWWVFWSGMSDFGEIQRSVERALEMPATFYDAPSSPMAAAASAAADAAPPASVTPPG